MHHHWTGYWEQRGMGRQPMDDLMLQLGDGLIRGGGRDIIGRFTFYGRMEQNGRVLLTKQYIGQHAVAYQGEYDGEGTIFGQWSIGSFDSGDFLLRLSRGAGLAGASEIEEIRAKSAQ
jgi:hypothetical protein